MNSLMARNFDELFDSVMLGFGAPTNIRFNTAKTKDLMPSYWSTWEVEEKDSTEKRKLGYKCVCRTVGINPEDVNVTMEDYGICVDGQTEHEDNKYTQHIELPISESVMSDIENISYKTLNGLTYIYIKMKSPEKRKVKINRVK